MNVANDALGFGRFNEGMKVVEKNQRPSIMAFRSEILEELSFVNFLKVDKASTVISTKKARLAPGFSHYLKKIT
jgi:hypothetical protein